MPLLYQRLPETMRLLSTRCSRKFLQGVSGDSSSKSFYQEVLLLTNTLESSAGALESIGDHPPKTATHARSTHWHSLTALEAHTGCTPIVAHTNR